MSAPKRVAPAITIGSLFTGIGGLDLSVEACFASLRSQATTVWQVEHDPFCNEVLARHFPLADRAVRDVRDAGARTLAPVDAICGGFPCQPVSLAGRRKAREDARWLWPEFARILGELRPRYAFLENVPGLLTADDGRAFGDVLGSLASLGYAAEWDHFRASDVGAPHRRERWFLLAYSDRGGRGACGLDGVGAAVGVGREGSLHAATAPNAGARGVAHADGRRSQGTDARRERAGVGVALGGRTVADALGVEGGERHDADVFGRRAGDAKQTRVGGGGGADGLAHAPRFAQREPTDETHAVATRGDARTLPRRSGESLADAGRVAHERRQPKRVRGGAVPPSAHGGSESGVAPLGAAQPGLGGATHGLPRGLDAHQWPAGRGEPQHAHEPLRTAHAVKDRPARLKALGNAVVWQQAALAWRVLWTRAQMEAA